MNARRRLMASRGKVKPMWDIGEPIESVFEDMEIDTQFLETLCKKYLKKSLKDCNSLVAEDDGDCDSYLLLTAMEEKARPVPEMRKALSSVKYTVSLLDSDVSGKTLLVDLGNYYEGSHPPIALR